LQLYDTIGLILGQRNYLVGGQSWLNTLYFTFLVTAVALGLRVARAQK
jgi:hypothetical protein